MAYKQEKKISKDKWAHNTNPTSGAIIVKEREAVLRSTILG